MITTSILHWQFWLQQVLSRPLLAQHQYPHEIDTSKYFKLQSHSWIYLIGKVWNITSDQHTVKIWNYNTNEKHWSLYHSVLSNEFSAMYQSVTILLIFRISLVCLIVSHIFKASILQYTWNMRGDCCECESMLKSSHLETWHVLLLTCPFLLRKEKWKVLSFF